MPENNVAHLRTRREENYAVNSANNRYNSIAGVDLEYDLAGNITGDENGYMYSWDYDNHLVAISKPGAGGGPTTLVEYVYDALGRRAMKTEHVSTGTGIIQTRYYYNGWQLLTEVVSDGVNPESKTNYAYGNALDEVLFYVANPGTTETVSYLTGDHLNSPAARLVFDDVTEQYQIAERYEYDAYGKRTVLNANYSVPATVPTDTTNIGFTGQRVESLDNANLELSYYKNRWYSTNQGRFLSHDPLDYIDGMNLYEYVKSMPFMLIDPVGLACENKCERGSYKCAKLSITVYYPGHKDVLKDKSTKAEVELDCENGKFSFDWNSIIKDNIKGIFKKKSLAAAAVPSVSILAGMGLEFELGMEYYCCNKLEKCGSGFMKTVYVVTSLGKSSTGTCWIWNWSDKTSSVDVDVKSKKTDPQIVVGGNYGGNSSDDFGSLPEDLAKAAKELLSKASMECKK